MKKFRLVVLNNKLLEVEYQGIKANGAVFLLIMFGILMFNLDKLQGLLQ